MGPPKNRNAQRKNNLQIVFQCKLVFFSVYFRIIINEFIVIYLNNICMECKNKCAGKMLFKTNDDDD